MGLDPAVTTEVLSLLEQGAQIPSLIQFDPFKPVPENQKSTREYFELVDDMILKELLSKRITGQLLTPPQV